MTQPRRLNGQDASTDKLGGSDLSSRVSALTGAGNFKDNTGVGALNSATTTEAKFRATVALIDQALQKGERLAALDLSEKAFGPKVTESLRADAGYLTEMVRRADAFKARELISPADVGRALELKERMEAAQKVLSEKWKPIQDDLAKLGMNYHASWVSITEDLAAAVGYATALYTALNKVPDWFAKRIGGAGVWQSITEATTTPEGRKASEASLGISSDPQEIAMVGANAKLKAALQDRANIIRSAKEATDIQTAVRGELSKDPRKQEDTSTARNTYDRAQGTVARETPRTEADTKAVGLGAQALAEYRAEALLTTAARQASVELTDKEIAKINALAKAAGEASAALAKANVDSAIKVGRDTAFLPADEVAIAQQLRGLYGDDVPRALASSEAAALRFNGALRQVGTSIENNLTSGLFDIVNGTKSVKAGFADMAASVLRDIERMIIKMMIVQPLMQGLQGLLGGSFTGALNANGSISGAVGPTSVGGAPLIGANAGGTDNWRGGLSIVGEKGPELVNLPRGAQVIPNDVLRTGGGNISAPVNIHIDATGADPAGLVRVQRQLAQLNAELPGRIVTTVKTARTQRML